MTSRTLAKIALILAISLIGSIIFLSGFGRGTSIMQFKGQPILKVTYPRFSYVFRRYGQTFPDLPTEAFIIPIGDALTFPTGDCQLVSFTVSDPKEHGEYVPSPKYVRSPEEYEGADTVTRAVVDTGYSEDQTTINHEYSSKEINGREFFVFRDTNSTYPDHEREHLLTWVGKTMIKIVYETKSIYCDDLADIPQILNSLQVIGGQK